MAANTSPIFGLTPKVGFSGGLTAANTNYDGTGTVAAVYTAGSNGSFVYQIVGMPQGTNIATLVRVFLNNGSSSSTASNNTHFIDVALAATTASATAAQTQIVIPLNIQLPASYVINVALGTAVSAGWEFCALGIDY